MAIESKTRIAIAASLVWMAMATVVILGTHGEAVARADTVVPTLEVETEWMAHPAHLEDDFAVVKQPSRC